MKVGFERKNWKWTLSVSPTGLILSWATSIRLIRAKPIFSANWITHLMKSSLTRQHGWGRNLLHHISASLPLTRWQHFLTVTWRFVNMPHQWRTGWSRVQSAKHQGFHSLMKRKIQSYICYSAQLIAAFIYLTVWYHLVKAKKNNHFMKRTKTGTLCSHAAQRWLRIQSFSVATGYVKGCTTLTFQNTSINNANTKSASEMKVIKWNWGGLMKTELL